MGLSPKCAALGSLLFLPFISVFLLYPVNVPLDVVGHSLSPLIFPLASLRNYHKFFFLMPFCVAHLFKFVFLFSKMFWAFGHYSVYVLSLSCHGQLAFHFSCLLCPSYLPHQFQSGRGGQIFSSHSLMFLSFTLFFSLHFHCSYFKAC